MIHITCYEICVYDEHPLAGWDIQYQAPDSRSRCTTPFDDIKYNVQHKTILDHKDNNSILLIEYEWNVTCIKKEC